MIISRHDLHRLPALHSAAGSGNVAELRRLLLDTAIESQAQAYPVADPQFAAQRDLTPLMVAAGSELGSVQTVGVLLEQGADPHAVSAAGVDALWYAAGSGDVERVAVLLAAGGQPQVVASDGRSAVAVAARAGGAEALRLLLQAGASPHPPSAVLADAGLSCEAIPLFAAAAAGSAPYVQLLLDAGALATLRDRDENTALMFAVGSEVVPLLLAGGCPRDARNVHGYSALDSVLFNHRLAVTAAMRENPECGDLRLLEPAVQRRQAAVAAALLDAGVDPEGRSKDGQTALVGYCHCPQVSAALVRLLLARGAQAHARDPEGQTALHAAAQNWNRPPELTDVIRVLVEAGLPVDVRDNRGRTPLHGSIAKESGGRGAIPVLLELGADIEARDAEGLTPLMLSSEVENNSYLIVRHLLERGANPRAHTPDGHTASGIAAQRLAQVENRLAAQVTTEAAQQISATARQRLTLRSIRVTLQALAEPGMGTPASEALPELPEPIWLGYRLLRRLAPYSLCPLETDHIEEVCSCAHPQLIEDMNRAACFATVESVPEWFLESEDGQSVEVHAYRAYPLSFEDSGAIHPLTAETLLGPGALPPQMPDLTRFTRLGYDVTQYLSRPDDWTGCSPLSCNGVDVETSTLVNRCCLLDDLAAAYDLAIHFGVRQPEPGPYVIVEVWRASSPYSRQGVTSSAGQ